jgi:thioredoxin 1
LDIESPLIRRKHRQQKRKNKIAITQSEENFFKCSDITYQMSNNFQILKMSADWCGPCRATKPVFEAFANSHINVDCQEVNVDQQGDLAKSYEVRSIPTLIFLKDGKIVDRHTGAFSLVQLEEMSANAFGI